MRRNPLRAPDTAGLASVQDGRHTVPPPFDGAPPPAPSTSELDVWRLGVAASATTEPTFGHCPSTVGTTPVDG
jgi:hypothetical protein